MKEISITISGFNVDFDCAQAIAKAIAARENPDTDAMAWFDKKHNKHSPSIVECNTKGVPGWEEYGRHHGGRWKIIINKGDYVFVYT